MKDRFEEIKRVIEELENKGIALLELEIWNEIDCLLDKELTDNQLMNLYYTVERVYLKSEDVNLSDLVRYCIKNLDKIYDMQIYEILMNC